MSKEDAKQSGITLYTAPTPNGFKVAVFMEELRGAYGLDYEVRAMDMPHAEHKEPWFIALNPNGRIPVIVDRNRNDFAVFETAAILLYLQEHYDPENKFGWDPKESPDEYSEMLQWLFFAHGGVGPMQGQLMHFRNAAPEKILYGIDRYINEVKRLYGVLDIRLGQDRDYLAGLGKGKYSIADMNVLPWLRIREYAGIPSLDEWPNVKRWCETSLSRPTWEIAGNVGRAKSTAALYRVE
ncbi:hypothetical protein GYMLUDRAFT_75087 [Collybiopsis luxurians FD-317 M1]|uniref:Glutathione transferase n=1 Tax=Collybiopsis luxurians FD-317 M1 TaxID=944289 RepID=A0A0D0CR54_9AGAR|nr:hypothetical protein GYMLUDRAFT_75087 [Collybiopsis luxurians FD-317 M1]